MRYRLFNHTADLGIDVFGKTQAELFSHAALALFDLMIETADIQTAQCRESESSCLSMVIRGADRTDLFVNFLREMLYLFTGEGLVLTACRIVRSRPKLLRAEIKAGPYDDRIHRVKTEIKAVTYHQAAVAKTAAGWRGRIIFDV